MSQNPAWTGWAAIMNTSSAASNFMGLFYDIDSHCPKFASKERRVHPTSASDRAGQNAINATESSRKKKNGSVDRYSSTTGRSNR